MGKSSYRINVGRKATIVTKGNGGLVEQVSDGVDCFHVNTYDVKEFSEALYKISLIPRDKVRKMGEIARDNAFQNLIMKNY
ncbi:glycosyltransferase [Sulfuracidifex metallicus]|uniref:glycosyltransferase n=1 Tax=Sulfuracidifex metallicus TaxID=47303 RepID=UPI000AF6C699|nr:hypothetical protein [Sulfuracidifex metallicus]